MKSKTGQQGQALVVLLVFMIMSITVTSAAVVIMISNSQAASTLEQGNDALSIAESGVENALLRLLRSPTYTGETLTVGEGSATVGIVGVNPKIVTSQGETNGFVRTVQVVVTMISDVWHITSWKEIF